MDPTKEKYLRCKNKEAVFICVMCDSFKLLCTRCDNYVHGLPSKRKHKRKALTGEKNFSNNEKISEKINNSSCEDVISRSTNFNEINSSPSKKIDWDYKFKLSPIKDKKQILNNQYYSQEGKEIYIEDEEKRKNSSNNNYNYYPPRDGNYYNTINIQQHSKDNIKYDDSHNNSNLSNTIPIPSPILNQLNNNTISIYNFSSLNYFTPEYKSSNNGINNTNNYI
jgi:hypothetical protein